MPKSIYLYSMTVPLHLAETLAQATREEIARSVQNGVHADTLVDMACVLRELESRIEEEVKEEAQEDGEG